MNVIRDDYILRVLEQISAMITKCIGLRTTGHLEEALTEVESAASLLPGPPPNMLSMVDASTAAGFLQQPTYIFAYARLVAERANVRRELGQNQEADIDEERALQLTLLSYEKGYGETAELKSLIDSLAGNDWKSKLSDDFQGLLTRLRQS